MDATQVCSREGCGRTGRLFGTLCHSHYAAARRYGQVDPIGPYERLMSNVDSSSGPKACHPWMGHRNNQGYGRFRVDGRMHMTHRWALEHRIGRPLSDGEQANHHCDNPPCCNVRHLYVGTTTHNMQDALRRGRNYWANRTHCAKGHEFTPDNTYERPGGGGRGCLTCRRERSLRHYRNKRIKAAHDA